MNDIQDLEFVSFDLETTGTDPEKDRIVEFGATVYRGRKLVSRGKIFFNPGIPIPDEASRVHHIYDHHVEKKGLFSAYVSRLIKQFDKTPMILGFNCLHFDVPLLNAEVERAGVDWRVDESRVLDLMPFVNWHHRGEKSRRLENLAPDVYGVNPIRGAAHSAAVDTQLTAELMWAMIDRGVVPRDLDAAREVMYRHQKVSDGEFEEWKYFLYRDRQTQRLRMGFGKHCGVLLTDAPKRALSWYLNNIDDLTPAARRAFEDAKAGRVQNELQRPLVVDDQPPVADDGVRWGGW